ncbi:hypothetical protein [Pseudomonas sp. GL-B-26]|uniref:hypothetical protein n=1 Tax=Pseudomonas sp. GL-B-26 TaxID=2832394 RepID=UPI001CBD79E8|nr:hypothetical protein [Pseudomonas sp. GL-B-26]
MNERTEVDPVEFHFKQILESEKLGHKKSKVSTTQGVMVALALADRRFAEPEFQNQPVKDLHAKLDQPQLAALKRFRDEQEI